MEGNLRKMGSFGVVPNTLLNDSSISISAKGLYGYIHCKPESWTFNLKSIASQNKDGITSIASAVKELEKSGWLKRVQRKGDGNKFSNSIYILAYIKNDFGDEDFDSTKGSPTSKTPLSENPIAEMPRHSNKDISNKEYSNKDIELNYIVNSENCGGDAPLFAPLADDVKSTNTSLDKKVIEVSKKQKKEVGAIHNFELFNRLMDFANECLANAKTELRLSYKDQSTIVAKRNWKSTHATFSEEEYKTAIRNVISGEFAKSKNFAFINMRYLISPEKVEMNLRQSKPEKKVPDYVLAARRQFGNN